MTVTKTGLLAEVVNRNNISTTAPKIELNDNFPAQNAFILDTARYISAQCSRRAGKTNGLAMRFFKTMEKHPKSTCLYLSLTQDSAKAIMWPILHEINDRYRIGCTFTESKMEIKHPNGAKLKLIGADLKNFIKRLKGRKYPGVGIDESQDMAGHLQSLIDDVLTPSIADYTDGWLAITGTPGPVPSGYFFEVTQNKKYGYSHHSWDLLSNPHMPNPQAFINDLMVKREWTEDNPTLLREYRNKWVLDVESLWIRYNEKINHYTELPKEKMHYVMGIDVGFNDADAIAIIGWTDASPVTYLVEEKVTKKQGITELVQQVEDMRKRYDVHKMVIDTGGLGKKIAEEMIRRHSIPVEAADKMRKQENVELLNDSLRTGKFKAKSNSRFALDSYLVNIDWDHSTPDKIVVKKKPHSDIIDAVLYGFKESYSYLHAPEKSRPKYGTKEWAEAQVDSMFEREMEGYQAENEPERKYDRWLKGES
jgi:hypothetical protein